LSLRFDVWLTLIASVALIDLFRSAALSPPIWGGLALYGLSVALWIRVLSKLDLSVAYPFVGLGFLMTMAFGAIFLAENVSLTRIMGTALVAVGCILVARSA
jgi:multidrug transporter EmrE-like cation transporter